MTRLMLAFLASAVAFPSWLAKGGYRGFLSRNEPRVKEAFSRRVTYHNLKNITSEWIRADEERAGKVLCAIALAGWLGAVLAAI
jgi:hypothetical protein